VSSPGGQRLLPALLLVLSLTGCGGGGSSQAPAPLPATGPAITDAQAARFLRQASFGPTPADIAEVKRLGFAGWIDAQLKQPASLELPYVRAAAQSAKQSDRVDVWFQNAVRGKDQLRQRTAFALSEILVVSDVGALAPFPEATAHYYDVLAENAFGNYRDLMEKVTLNPAMGAFLSVLGNQKSDPARNIRPDENYARELMQLFTIGLVQLNADGTVRLDGAGKPIPTYDQSVVEGYARAFTGWTLAPPPTGSQGYNFVDPMQPLEALHDQTEKRLLNGAIGSAGASAAGDLKVALDSVFAHPNVGPFVSRQLIQRLVASNPSADYVRRIVAVFEDDGEGRRGNLGAVVRAILLDPEARTPPADSPGKLMEPLMRLTGVWRAYDAASASGRFRLDGLGFILGQAPLSAPSVFNFFRPDYAPPGTLRDAGILAPEMQITDENLLTLTANLQASTIFGLNSGGSGFKPDDVIIDIQSELPSVADPVQLADRTALRMLGGDVSPDLRAAVRDMVQQWPADQQAARVAEAIYTIATSPEYATLR
jgi:uncharacterized protein (DUF1800 family)